MLRRFMLALLLAFTTLLSLSAVRSADRALTLKDPLGHTWTNELVHYDLSFAPDECWAQSAALLNGHGTPAPVQLSGVTLHPDGSVASARVWFTASLPAGGTQHYTFHGGTQREKPRKYQSDLDLNREPHAVTFTTAHLSVRLLNGTQQFTPPLVDAAIPAPVQMVSRHGDMRAGGAWFDTRLLCTGYSAEVTEDGPVFKQAAIRYTFAAPDGWAHAQPPAYRITVRVAAGQDVACISDEEQTDAALGPQGPAVAGLSRSSGAYTLDNVKEWELEWPEGVPYPHLGGRTAGDAREATPVTPTALQQDYSSLVKALDSAQATVMGWHEHPARGSSALPARTFPTGDEDTGLAALPTQVQDYARRADSLLAAGTLTRAQRVVLRARLAFFCYLLWDAPLSPTPAEAFDRGWGERGRDGAETQLALATGRALLSVLLSDHPLAKNWVPRAAHEFTELMPQYFSADGAPRSTPRYMPSDGLALLTMLDALQGLEAAGDLQAARDIFQKFAHFLLEMLPPPDPRVGLRMLPPAGKGSWEGNVLALRLAAFFQERDPLLARQLLWTALASGTTAEDAQRSVPGLQAEPPHLGSSVYPGYGAFLRNGAGSEQESYLQVRFGDFTSAHTQNDGGAFLWYARGVPLAVDFAVPGGQEMAAPWQHNTLSYDHQLEPNSALAPIGEANAGRDGDLHGHIVAFAGQPGADYLCGAAERHRFVRLPYLPTAVGTATGPGTEFLQVAATRPFLWTRQLVFVKDDAPEGPNYLVIADDLRDNREFTPAFNFWCLADSVVQNHRQLFFNGPYGIDLDMLVLEPAEGRIELGPLPSAPVESLGIERPSPGGKGEPAAPAQEHETQLVRVYAPRGGEGFRVLLYPRAANEPMPRIDVLAHGLLIRVTLPGQTHWILLSHDPVVVTDGSVKFNGTAAVVKQWRNGRMQLTLLAPGRVECAGKVLSSTGPASKEY